MNTCFFVSDLQGELNKIKTLLKIIKKEKPDFIFISGDFFIKPGICHTKSKPDADWNTDLIFSLFDSLKLSMDCNYPEVYIIPGLCDQKQSADLIYNGEKADLWRNINNNCVVIGKYRFYGFNFLQAAESENGQPDFSENIRFQLNNLIHEDDLEFAVMLFYFDNFNASLFPDESEAKKRFASAGKTVKEFVLSEQPYIIMYNDLNANNHNEFQWKETCGRTLLLSSTYCVPELAIIRFDLHDPDKAIRMVFKNIN